jgi:signal transduction histidine kinase/ActR/RegA family two-component response regulator
MTQTSPPELPARHDLVRRLLAGGLISIAAWSVFYGLLGHWPAVVVEAIYGVHVTVSLLWVKRRPENMGTVVRVNILGILLICASNTIVTGGLFPSGLFMLWGIIGPLSAMVFLDRRAIILACAGFILTLLAMAALPAGFLGGTALPAVVQPWLAVANIIGSGALSLATLGYFLGKLESEQAAREQSQRQLLEQARFESLSTLAGGIAHDFNNVLMALFGNLEMAQAALPANTEAAARLARAQAALEQATGLTHQLLSFASGGAPVLSTASIGSTIRESASFVLTGSSARAAFDLDDDLWAIEADLGQISRLIQNLAINASQAMPQGGHITFRARNEIATSAGPANLISGDTSGILPRGGPEVSRSSFGLRFVVIEVEDQGHGISEADRLRIFDPFFSTRSGNTGLGLTTCFTIVRDHRGFMEVESEPGKGTLFRIWLPASSHQLPETDAPTSEVYICAEDTSGQRILVMDDEPAVLEVLCAMLENLGYQPIATEEGGEALATWQLAEDSGRPFHAVILDLTIRGGMGGVETCQELRARQADVPIVASSGYANDQIMSNFQDHGFSAVLRKPYRLEELNTALSGIFGS